MLPRSDMVCSCMSLTFGILVLLCPFGLTRPVFVSYWCNIHAVRGRVKLFATEENVAKQEERKRRRKRGRRKRNSRLPEVARARLEAISREQLLPKRSSRRLLYSTASVPTLLRLLPRVSLILVWDVSARFSE